MKFAKELEAESVPEWKRAYIDYSGLKKRLKNIAKAKKVASQSQSTFFDENYAPRDPETEIDNQIHTVDPDLQKPAKPGLPGPYGHSRLHSATLPPDIGSSLHRRQSTVSGSLFRRLSTRFMREDADLTRTTSYPGSSHPGAPTTVEEVHLRANDAERAFFNALDQEFEKISRFYKEKESEAVAKLKALKIQIRLISEFGVQLSEMELADARYHENGSFNPLHWITGHRPGVASPDGFHLSVKYDNHMSYNVARSRLKKAFTEFYRSMELLRSYKSLNQTGFRKILKKFDKTAGWVASTPYMRKVRRSYWVTSNELDEAIRTTEDLFVKEFANGHRRRAMAKLRVPEKQESYTGTTLRIGLFLGAAIAMFYQVFSLASEKLKYQVEPSIIFNLQIYACFSLPILFCLGFAVNTFVWNKSRINYKFIFELNPRTNLSHDQFAELPSLMIFLMSVIMYIDFSESLAPTIPSNLCPMILFIILMAICLCPFKILYYSARKWLGATLARIFMSYCYSVEFRDFFIADELNSLAYSFWTLAYFFCAYSWHWEDLGAHCSVMQMWSTPVLASVPAWWRLLQCIRRYKDSSEFVHLQNGCKYITSIAAAMTTGTRRIYPFLWLKILWIVACSINSAYTSIWDIKMDWGLLRPNSRHYLLRNELVFYKWAYYVAVPINVLLRFAWTLNLANFAIHPQLLGFILAVVEALRRLQWNFFRLENEHLNNCGAYCAIKEIPLPFAITDAAKALYAEEEGSIQAPPPETDGVPHAPTMAPQPLVRHQSLLHPLQSPMDGPAGTFYARRDFENRRENIEVEEGSHPHRIARQGSVVLDALDRIRDIRDSDTSSEGSEGDENEEEEGDSDSPSTLHENTVANSRL